MQITLLFGVLVPQFIVKYAMKLVNKIASLELYTRKVLNKQVDHPACSFKNFNSGETISLSNGCQTTTNY